jgi:hypothetical protein
MIISLIVEPRSGSTNLANCFYNNIDFTVLFQPSDPKSKWYTKDTPNDYRYLTKHLMIKEDFLSNNYFKELVGISDKVIFLYRENIEEQISSWVNAKITDNWENNWSYDSKIMLDNETEIIFFKYLKEKFVSFMEANPNSLKISYEELYNNNGFDKIREFLGLDNTKDIIFPIGKRYRVNVNKSKKFI